MKKNPNFIKMERVEAVVANVWAAMQQNPSYTKYRKPLKNMIRCDYNGLTVDVKIELRNKSTEMWAVVEITNDVMIFDTNRARNLVEMLNYNYSPQFGFSTVIYNHLDIRIDEYDKYYMDHAVELVLLILNNAIKPWDEYSDPLLKARK